jgi:Uma2 family endonuclease
MTTKAPTPLPDPLPIAPTQDEWQAMTADERERFLLKVVDALSDPRSVMSEGRPHKRAKSRAVDMLGLHFKTLGRTIYLAEEMAVVYPGEEIFSPDVLAVLDVPQPDDDQRLAWVVAQERKGLDLVLEVLHRGDRNKDLVVNVERYARLGIPEYFVYDRGRQQIHGYRLNEPGARRYQRIIPQGGRYRSGVLGLDMVIQDGALQFYQGSAELIGSDDLIGRLTGMVEALEAKAEQATAKADLALAGVREGILAVLGARGISCPDDVRMRLSSCDDPAMLQRWLARATSARSAAEVLEDEPEGH